MNRILLVALAMALGLAATGGRCEPVRRPHVTVELVAETTAAAPGSTLQAAVILTADKGWHTYWRNPGDAGEATAITWALPAGWKAGEIVWPAPHRLPVGPIMNYGYEGRALLAVPITVPTGARVGETAKLVASVDYLVCAEVCVPGSAQVNLSVPITKGAPTVDPVWGGEIQRALADSPKPSDLTATYQLVGRRLALAVTSATLAHASPSDVYFYPYDDKLIDQAKPQAVDLGAAGLTLTMTPGAAFAGSAAPPSQVSGVLAVDGKAYEIVAAPGAAPAGVAGLGSPRSAERGGGMGLPLAAAGAFLGGLILNLMPCVFPILSMKAAALARHASVGGGRTQGVAFLAGVLVSFLALAVALIAARAAGSALGWGFQLQSPAVVAILALIMLAAALNLSGLYEIGASVQGLGAGLSAHGETVGSFLTGILAVVVAAPCTAPFMGPALGWALTQPPAATLTVFAGLGLGFAAPFTVTAFSPWLMRRLPRPGAWMETLKKALAFPMYAAAAWLVWVLAQQTGSEGLARLLAAGVVLALAAWLFGLAQHRRSEGKPGLVLAALAAGALAISVGAVAAGRYGSASAQSPAQANSDLRATPWSPERLAALRAAGTPVLVNFTAAWCVTCQVNERVAFSSGEVADAARRAGAAYLVADWTNRDGAIAKALADQGRIGVPLYLVYAPGAAEPKVLPQILTPAMLVEALNTAAKKPAG
jgi:thiol:disulfide interchange protein DsbD